MSEFDDRDRHDANSNGHDGDGDDARPSLPPQTLEELQELVETTIHEQEYVRRHLNTLEQDVRTLVAGTSPAAKLMDKRLERIEGCVQTITNKIQIMQWAKTNGPLLLAFFGGGFVCCSILIWLITHTR